MSCGSSGRFKPSQDVSAIILAAGQGTRMKSKRAKVLHEIAGVPMIRYVVETALSVVDNVVLVVGHQAKSVQAALSAYPFLRFALQKEQLGTGHAVMTALPELPANALDVVILCGDTPLIRPQTIFTLINQHKARQADLTVLATRLQKPFGYGRILSDAHGNVMRIVEESDASNAEKKITLVNTGAYCAKIDFLAESLPNLRNDNAQGEFYLTDIVDMACKNGQPVSLVEAPDSFELLGINTRQDLIKAENLVRQRINGGNPKSS